MKSSIDVAYVAGLARLELSEQETETFQKQIAGILDYVEALQQIDVSSVPDTPIDPNLPTNVLREDTQRESLPVESVLRNAPKSANHLVIMPKIVE
ncbi:MAG: Asp-tRNA(Asn)/Glu-tRNA(Gln) amidotransferase subunit GatC [Blastochloris sp.]|nr:Asp-tRNA(Asn)/Glu-tRNA(Gln) amidotransferase subunit GatC [Blastochloris sp.]